MPPSDSQRQLSGAHAPLLLDDPDAAWIVTQGKVDVFIVAIKKGKAFGARRHLYRAEVGDTLMGVNQLTAGHDLGLLAVGLEGTELKKRDLATMRENARDNPVYLEAAAWLIDSHIAQLCGALAPWRKVKFHKQLRAGDSAAMSPKQNFTAHQHVVWARIHQGRACLAGVPSIALAQNETIPLCQDMWVETTSRCHVSVLATPEYMETDPDWHGLSEFHRRYFALIDHFLSQEQASQLKQRERSLALDKFAFTLVLGRLASVHTGNMPTAYATRFPIFTALGTIGRYQGINFVPPLSWNEELSQVEKLATICHASRVRFRRVDLPPRWWEKECGAMLIFFHGSGRVVSAIPTFDGYEIHHPDGMAPEPLTEMLAESLETQAYFFYRPFPEQELTLRHLVRFCFRSSWWDLTRALTLGLVVGTMAVFTPAFADKFTNNLVEMAALPALVTFSCMVVLIAVAMSAIQVARAHAMVRFSTRTINHFQTGLMDRLLNLPMSMLKLFPVHDLVNRAQTMRQYTNLLHSAMAAASLHISAVLACFALMLWLDFHLSKWVVVAIVTCEVYLLGSLYTSLRMRRKMADTQREVQAFLFQLLSALPKFRSSAAEFRAFSIWAEKCRMAKLAEYRDGQTLSNIAIYEAVLPSISLFILFFAYDTVYSSSFRSIPLGHFVAICLCASAVHDSLHSFNLLMLRFTQAAPHMERLSPFLEQRPETSTSNPHPGILTGDIEFNQVAFRYYPNGPLILDRVSFRVQPGEFVAFVGASGSGKSTLFNLLLGFLNPETGAVYYDGQNLKTVDASAVRQQIGSVLDTSNVFTGTIMSNIACAMPVTPVEAWEALNMAGMEEQVRSFPMGLQTFVTEGGAVISGGQRQRLLLARALVSKPRILLLDDATSAVDNAMQKNVMAKISNIDATRLVIAHRLNTVRAADRIIVLEQGRIVQMGNYDELMAQEGLFAQMAKRQLV